MKAGWIKLPFVDAIADESGGNIKTPQSEFLPYGRFAVVDQGKNLISGYIDNESHLCKASLPVIVFGDHTRCFKFIDFPFCMGADGVKILRPKVEADVKYLYYYLRQLHLHNGGYDRHFKYLKRSDVLLPPPKEQRRIAEILDRAEELRSKRRKAIAQLDTLTQAIFLEMFGDPITNLSEWEVLQLQKVVKPGTIVTYGIVQAGEEFPNGVPYIRTGDIVNGEIDKSGLRHTNPQIAAKFERSRVETGDLVISIRATVGTTALVPPELDGANLTQGTAKISPGNSVDRLYLLNYLRTSKTQHWISQQVKGATFREITLTRLRELPVAIPPPLLQQEFAARVEAVEKLKAAHRASLSELDVLFASLQHRAFRGEL